MTYFPVLWVLMGTGLGAPRNTLTFADQVFVAAKGSSVVQVPIDTPKPAPRTKVEFRSNATFVLWDDRGLTIRVGSKTSSTRLKQIPTSPRLRNRDAIVGTVEAVRSSGRSLDARGISGARRIGKNAYLVVRWEDRPGQAWLEALVSVDLAASDPTPKAVAVLPGLSFSTMEIADNLVASHDGVSMLIHSGASWGIWSYHPDTQQSDFHELGGGIKYASVISPTIAAFVEKTDHGTYTVGTIDLATTARVDTAESPSLWRMLDSNSPAVASATNDAGAHVLAELSGGAVMDLPEGASIRRAGKDVLIWLGGRQPNRAWLYDPMSWTPLAWWRATTPRNN